MYKLKVRVHNEFLSKAVQALFFAKGISWSGEDWGVSSEPTDCNGASACLYVDNFSKLYHGKGTGKAEFVFDAKTDWDEIEEFLNKPKLIQIKLNSQYTAIINKDTKTVKVGCSEFEFKVVDELYNAIHERS